MRFQSILIALALIASISATAATTDPYIIGSGGKGGAYFTMTDDVIGKCSARAGGLNNQEEKGGSTANLVNGATKKNDLFWTQSDVYALAVMENPATYNNFRVVAGLHNEEIHVFVLPDLKVGKTLGVGGKAPVTLADLGTDDIKIGAWGGSLKTADALSRQIMPKRVKGWKPTVVSMSPPDEKNGLIAQMKAADVSVVIRVSGKPDKIFADLPPNSLRPLSVDQEIAKVNPAFFTVGTLDTYTNLSAQTVQTIAVQALLTARPFDDPEDIARISALRDCMAENLSTFRNRRGYHPKWADVPSLDPRVTVTMFPFVKATATAPAPAAPTAPTKKK